MNKIFFLILMTVLFSLVSCSSVGEQKITANRPNKIFFNPVWIKNLDPLYETGNLPIALQSPLIHEGIVYVGNNNGWIQAYELENGRMVFNEFDGSSYHVAPVSFNDQIIYGTVSGRVISRHYTTGKIKYSVDLQASVETRGVIYQGRIFFHLRNHQIFCLDAETGKILWAYKRSVSNLTTLQRASAPLIYKDKVLVGLADGTLVALSLDEGSLLYETKLTTATKFQDVDNSAFILNDLVYLGAQGGVLSLIDPNNGKILKKSEFIASRAPYKSVQADNTALLYFGTPSGELLLTDKNLTILKKLQVANGVITSIVPFKDGLAVATTSGEILMVDLGTFKVKETFLLGHAYSAVFGDLESKDRYLSVLSSRNRLFTFK